MESMQELKETVAALRGPDGCPWDRAQTHQSLTTCLIEECAELLDTIDREDLDHMREELGDVLLQVVMHAQLADEESHFDLEKIASDANSKLIRRHPHVFGDQKAGDPEEALARWNEMKELENGGSGRGKDKGGRIGKALPPQLPALSFASKILKQLAAGGIEINEYPDAGRPAEIGSNFGEGDAGEAIFAIVVACRNANIDPESALRRYTRGLVERIENGGNH